MNTINKDLPDNWREVKPDDYENATQFYFDLWKVTVAENSRFESTLKEKDREIEALRMSVELELARVAKLKSELSALKDQIPGLLKEQRKICADNAKVKRTDMMGDARCYTDKDSILSAPSPQIKQP